MSIEQQKQKEEILKKIRAATVDHPKRIGKEIDFESEIYQKKEGDLVQVFAESIVKNAAKVFGASHLYDAIEQIIELHTNMGWESIFCTDIEIVKIFKEAGFSTLSEDPKGEAQVSVSFCDGLIARLGLVCINSEQQGRLVSILPDNHIIIAYENQLFYDLKDYLGVIYNNKQKTVPSMVSLIGGPSRTADIEKTLVQGAHGPKELYIFVIEGK